MNDSRAIGIFDSGLGGLTVYEALRKTLPHEDFIYLGDTARLPYGSKSRETVVRYAKQNAQRLIREDIKLLVVACNTASAQALPDLQKQLPHLPCLGVIEPGAKAAAKASATGQIVVLATEGTVRSGAYPTAIQRIKPTAQVHALACNLLVGLVEEGWCEGPEAEAVVQRYLRHLQNVQKVTFDTLVLGCTHFPLLANTIRKGLPPGVAIVDSASSVALDVRDYLKEKELTNAPERQGNNRFFVTDAPKRFQRLASRFLPDVTGLEAILADLTAPC
jgi:glutamate racemase